MAYSEKNLVWLDLEMTGLDPRTDHIIEIATIVTDDKLQVLAEGPNIVIHQPDEIMDNMNDWCKVHHGKSGLTQRVRESSVTLEQAKQETLDFLAKYVPEGVAPLCGNSIGQDRRFLFMHMPELENFFHYRSIDVSTLKVLAKMWRPEILKGLQKTETHRALDDIRESIAEMQLYHDEFIKLA